MVRQGIDVISLSIGEPDFDTPEHISDACCQSIRRGDTHYAPTRGIPDSSRRSPGEIPAENGFACSTDQVIATAGAKHAIAMAMEACLNPNDEVIILDPAWVSYRALRPLAGGRVVHCKVNEKNFQPDDRLLDKITSSTKMIVVNSPSNPTGAVFTGRPSTSSPMSAPITSSCAMSDEIYQKLIYGKEHISLASIGDMAGRTITINGFSKAYAMTGWRLGYAVAPVEVIRQMTKSSSTVSPTRPHSSCGAGWRRSRGTRPASGR